MRKDKNLSSLSTFASTINPWHKLMSVSSVINMFVHHFKYYEDVPRKFCSSISPHLQYYLLVEFMHVNMSTRYENLHKQVSQKMHYLLLML